MSDKRCLARSPRAPQGHHRRLVSLQTLDQLYLLKKYLYNRLPFLKRPLILVVDSAVQKAVFKVNEVCGAKTRELNLRGRCTNLSWLCMRECWEGQTIATNQTRIGNW